MKTGRVSVIMPSLNMGRYLDAALASVARQDTPVHEVVLVELGSADETLAVAERWMKAGLPLRLLRRERMAPGPARNLGVAASTGDVVAFLDPDDLWPVGKVTRQLSRLQGSPHLAMAGGVVLHFDQVDETGLEPVTGAQPVAKNYYNLGASLYRRETLDELGGFDPDLVYAEDVDLMMRLRESGRPFVILRSVELYYRQHAHSMTTRNDPRRASDFRHATLKSLRRRRASGLAGVDLAPFASHLEPERA